MMRTRIAALALIGFFSMSLDALGQTCRGAAPIDRQRPVALGGGFSKGDGLTSVPGTLVAGSDSAFGGVVVTHTAIDDTPLSSTLVGGEVGGQLPLAGGRTAMLCPIVGLGYQRGPTNIDVIPTFYFKSWQLLAGGSVGFIAAETGAMQFVPTAGLFVERNSVKATFDGKTEHLSDTVGRALLGVGVVFNRRLALVPRANVPLAAPGSDPSFSLVATLNFGRP
jgi:hypothetical protein